MKENNTDGVAEAEPVFHLRSHGDVTREELERITGVMASQAPDAEALQWAVKTLRFLMPGTPVGPHAAFEEAVQRLTHGVEVLPPGVEPSPEGFGKVDLTGIKRGPVRTAGVAVDRYPTVCSQSPMDSESEG